jgi:hypothetical protein
MRSMVQIHPGFGQKIPKERKIKFIDGEVK